MTLRITLIALAAAAGANGPALAQSSVNISGMLDIGIYRDVAGKTQVGSIQRSNIAFSGAEDLGGGLSALFKLSHRFDPDTGTAEGTPNKPFWHGESTVGLKGAFGTLKFGRALDAIYANDWAFDPWYNFDRVASPAWDLWHYNFPSDPLGNNGTAEYGRLNNGVFYDSPSVGGVALHLSASPEKRNGDRNRPVGGAITYDQGPVAAMLGHAKNSAGHTDTFVGLKGTFSGLGVMGVFDKSKAGTSEAKAVTLGLQYTLGLTTLNGGWGRVKVDGVKAEEVLSAGALYALSKRTSLYADLANKKFPAFSKTVYGVGMAHSF